MRWESKTVVAIRYAVAGDRASIRRVVPIRIRFAAMQPQQDEQWLLDAFDIGLQSEQSFALVGLKEWGVTDEGATSEAFNGSGAFVYHGWPIAKAMRGLYAYYQGAFDSGVSDEGMRQAVVDHFASLDENERRAQLAECARGFLTSAAVSQGYGLADVAKFIEWVADIGIAV